MKRVKKIKVAKTNYLSDSFLKFLCLISLTSVILHLSFIGLLLISSVYIVETFFNLGMVITIISFIIFIVCYLQLTTNYDEEAWEELEEYN